MRIDILTLFPEACEPFFAASILGRAQTSGRVEIRCHNIRDHAQGVHRKVDDAPFGGGPGMVMMCQPLWDAVLAVEAADSATPARPPRRILMTPQGVPLTQALVEQLSREARLLIIAGHYEGIDERVIEALAPLEISLGDYVLSGGELGAMVLIDAVARLLPGALGHEGSNASDSFSPAGEDGRRLLDCPHFTKPREWMGRAVPEVLLSGDHANIAKWRLDQMESRTRARRPDLMGGPALDADRGGVNQPP